jgi:hypothetical protein
MAVGDVAQPAHQIVIVQLLLDPTRDLAAREVLRPCFPMPCKRDRQPGAVRAFDLSDPIRSRRNRIAIGVVRRHQRRIACEPARTSAPPQRRLGSRSKATTHRAQPIVVDSSHIDGTRRQVMIDHLLGEALERMPPGCGFERDHAKRPPIGLVVENTGQCFGRGVLRRARAAGEVLCGFTQRRNAKVG